MMVITLRRLCTVDDVKRWIDVSGRWTDDEINSEIENQTEDIYQECGYPLAASLSGVQNISVNDEYYLKYYLGENRVYDIERVFVGTVTKRELEPTIDYDKAKIVGMIKLTSSTVAGIRLSTDQEILTYYVPMLFTKYCALRTAQSLLEKIDIISNGKTSKELEVINKRIEYQEKMINNRIGVKLSTESSSYDENYGINQKTVEQDFDKNEYLWREDSKEE